MYKGHRVVDGHVHYCAALPAEEFAEFLEGSGTDMANVAVISRGTDAPDADGALRLKELYPGRFFVCGGLDTEIYRRGGGDMGRRLAE